LNFSDKRFEPVYNSHVSNLSIVDVARSALPSLVWADSIQVVCLGSTSGGAVDEPSPFRGVYRPIDPTRAVLIDLESQQSLSNLELRRILGLYPSEHRVWVLAVDDSGAARVEPTEVQSLVQGVCELRLRGLYVEALDRLADRRGFDTLSYIVARLRAPDGCPWDREQDYGSIKKHLIEETYEAIAALDEADYGKFAEELGDVLLQVIMYSQLAREAGDFTLEDVLQSVNDKLVRRHPHVFGEIEVKDSAEVLRNWEKIKRTEPSEKPGPFGGVPEAAPALMRAEAIQSRAERYGWKSPDAVPSAEAIEAAGANRDAQLIALGDLLFGIVAVARRCRLDPEEALRLATNRFRGNFDLALADHPDHDMAFNSLSIDEQRKILATELTDQGLTNPG
jgi:tetrapyrrole methylase family protein/MazG family protein